jgi:predicted nucleic acid-binding Zn ribbon protein
MDGCIVCNGGMATDRKLTCSPECYDIYRSWKAIDYRPPLRTTFSEQMQQHRTNAQARAPKGWLQRNCDQCGGEFKASRTNQYCCSSACQAVKINTFARRQRRTDR